MIDDSHPEENVDWTNPAQAELVESTDLYYNLGEMATLNLHDRPWCDTSTCRKEGEVNPSNAWEWLDDDIYTTVYNRVWREMGPNLRSQWGTASPSAFEKGPAGQNSAFDEEDDRTYWRAWQPHFEFCDRKRARAILHDARVRAGLNPPAPPVDDDITIQSVKYEPPAPDVLEDLGGVDECPAFLIRGAYGGHAFEYRVFYTLDAATIEFEHVSGVVWLDTNAIIRAVEQAIEATEDFSRLVRLFSEETR